MPYPPPPTPATSSTISTFNQHTQGTLATNTVFIQTLLLNNYTITNQTIPFSGNALTGNSFTIYMPLSAFQNPNGVQTTATASTQASGFFLGLNNYCGVAFNNTPRSFMPYLVDGNGSLYTFSILSGYGTGGVGDYMQIIAGVSKSTGIAVQQYLIQSSPFALALENGAPYSFKFYDSNCHFIYQTNVSIWGNPISISIPLTK